MDYHTAAVIVSYIEKDKDLCSFGLASTWTHQVAIDEMARRYPKAAAGDLCSACLLGFPPFIQVAAKRKATFEQLAYCYGCNRSSLSKMAF